MRAGQMAKTYKQLRWSDVKEGQDVPAISLDMTFSRVLLSAVSTIDYFPGHHDDKYAKGQGQETIYLNTMTYWGFIDRAITDWAGPATFITRRKFAMLKSVYAGDKMYAKGKVTRVYKDDTGRSVVDINLEIGTQRGVCFPAEVTAMLPN